MADLPPIAPSDPESGPALEAVQSRGRRMPLLILALFVAIVVVVGTVGTWLAPFQAGSTAIPSSGLPSSAAVPSAAPVSSAALPSSAAASPAAIPSSTPVPGSTVPGSPPTGTIAIIDAGGALSTVDDRGGSVVSYAVPGVVFQFPTWSPDGSHIAAIGQGPGGTGVYVFGTRADGTHASDPAVVYTSTDHAPFYLYWAPDGRQVTFLTNEPNGMIALRVAPADASSPGTTLRQGAPMYWAFVDRSRILVHSGGGASDPFLGEVGLDGKLVAPAVAGAGLFRPPAASFDGRYRAYAATGPAAAASVVVERADGSARHEIPVIGTAAVYFDPTSDSLAFLAADTQGADAALPVGPLRVVDAASGKVRTVLKGLVVAFFWSPDGKTIAALRVPEPGDDNLASVVPGFIPAVARTVGRPPVSIAAAPGLPLGLVFVDVATGAIRSRQTVSLSDTFVYQLLPYFDQYALSHRFWSPDSASVAFPTVAEDGISHLFVFPANGHDARRVADGVSGSWSPLAVHSGS